MPHLGAIGDNLIADAIMIGATSVTFRAMIKHVIRVTLDKRQEIAFWIYAPLMVLLMIVAIRLNTPSPSTQVIYRNDGIVADWPTLSNADTEDLISILSKYRPKTIYLNYGDTSDKELAVTFAQAMAQAGWPSVGIGGEGIRIGLYLQTSKDLAPLAEELRQFCKTNLHAVLEVDSTGTDYPGPGDVNLYIGRRPL